jgi:hypothetical protein
LPLTLNILRDFIKSTQPGIEAADQKVGRVVRRKDVC